MPVLPGGKIISGVGGRIWGYPNHEPFVNVRDAGMFRNEDGKDPLHQSAYPLEIQQWSISRTLIVVEVPHSGCVGGVTKRVIGQTWRYSASLPLDQDNFPDSFFGVGELGYSEDVRVIGNVAIAFYLGDVKINPEARYMDMTQAFYYSPRVINSHINPVLNAAGDVIRYNISGEEDCRLFLLPDEQTACERYTKYLQKHKGWL